MRRYHLAEMFDLTVIRQNGMKKTKTENIIFLTTYAINKDHRNLKETKILQKITQIIARLFKNRYKV